jgi:hypothetical protein
MKIIENHFQASLLVEVNEKTAFWAAYLNQIIKLHRVLYKCQLIHPEKSIVRISNKFLRKIIKFKLTALRWNDKKLRFNSSEGLVNCCKRVLKGFFCDFYAVFYGVIMKKKKRFSAIQIGIEKNLTSHFKIVRIQT